MAKSIIQREKRCYVTGRTDSLHVHHVFYGTANRKLSEKYGLKVWLTAEYHNASNNGVHCGNSTLDKKIKEAVQRQAMEHYDWSIEDFIKIFGRSYTDD